MDAPDHLQAPAAAEEGTPWTCRTTTSAARRCGRDALDAPGSPPAPAAVAEGTPWTCRITTTSTAAAEEGTPWTRPDHHQHPQPWGRKNRRVYTRLFYLLVKNQCIIFCHLMPLKFLLGTIIYFYHFCSRHRIRAMFRI